MRETGTNFVCVFFLLLSSGCAWTIRRIEEGNELRLADFGKIQVDQDTLGDVLSRLGPPDNLIYSPALEILEYREGLFQGTDLTATAIFENLPGLGFLAGLFRRVFRLASGNTQDIDEFSPQDPVQRLLPSVLRAVGFGALGGFSNEQILELRNRRVQYRRLRVTIDRASRRVLEKSFRDPFAGKTSLVRSTFLRD